MRFLPFLPIWLVIVLLVAVAGLLIWCIIKKERRSLDNFRRIGILAVIVLLIMHPVFQGGYSEAQLTNLNVYFAIDNTNSMAAKDCDNGSLRRYEKVAQDIKDIARQFPGAQYSVITQDISTYVAMPPSTSLDTLYAYADAIWPKPDSYSRGSNSAELLEKTLDQISAYDEEHPERINILFYLGDGEDTTTNAKTIYTQLKKHIATGAILGYGTKDGGTIPKVSPYSPREFAYGNVADDNGDSHKSRIDETNLQGIATKLGIKYYNLANDKTPANLSAEISEGVEMISTQDVDAHTEIYWLIALLLIGLLLWDFYVVLTRILQEREVK